MRRRRNKSISEIAANRTESHIFAERMRGFHRDRDCFSFVKLFTYLNDVDADAGPHEFIKLSHSAEALHAAPQPARPEGQVFLRYVRPACLEAVNHLARAPCLPQVLRGRGATGCHDG